MPADAARRFRSRQREICRILVWLYVGTQLFLPAALHDRSCHLEPVSPCRVCLVAPSGEAPARAGCGLSVPLVPIGMLFVPAEGSVSVVATEAPLGRAPPQR